MLIDRRFTFFAKVLPSKASQAAPEKDSWAFWIKASTDSVDKQGDVVTSEALAKMATLDAIDILLSQSHESAMAAAGDIVAVGKPQIGDNGHSLLVRCEPVYSHPYSQGLRWLIENNASALGASISGFISEGGLVFDGAGNRRVTDIFLDHILLARAGACVNPETEVFMATMSDWLGQINKAASLDYPQHDVSEITVGGDRLSKILTDHRARFNKAHAVLNTTGDPKTFLRDRLISRRG